MLFWMIRPVGVKARTSPCRAAYPARKHCSMNFIWRGEKNDPIEFLQLFQIQSAAQAKLQYDVIGDVANAFFLQCALAMHKVSEMVGIIKPSILNAAVRRRAKAKIILAVPVNQVVPPFVTGTSKIADFILGKPSFFQADLRHKGKICRLILCGQSGRWVFQQICGNVTAPDSAISFIVSSNSSRL